MRFPAFLGFAVLLGAGHLAAAGQPSFDCLKTSRQIEEVVCTNADLAALDAQLAEFYAAAQKKLPEPAKQQLRGEQSAWVQRRNECWKPVQAYECTRRAYESRIAGLKRR